MSVQEEFVCFSKNKKQKLMVYFYPGNSKYHFAEFEVANSQNVNLHDNLSVIEKEEFISESVIKIGGTAGELISIKGDPNAIRKTNSREMYIFKVDDPNSTFLLKYNMPLYYAEYEFENG